MENANYINLLQNKSRAVLFAIIEFEWQLFLCILRKSNIFVQNQLANIDTKAFVSHWKSAIFVMEHFCDRTLQNCRNRSNRDENLKTVLMFWCLYLRKDVTLWKFTYQCSQTQQTRKRLEGIASWGDRFRSSQNTSSVSDILWRQPPSEVGSSGTPSSHPSSTWCCADRIAPHFRRSLPLPH